MASFGEQIIPTSAVKGGLEESLKLSIKELSLKVFMVVLLR